MRVLLALIGVTIFLVGCTGRVSVPAPPNRPLVFEARQSGGAFVLFLNDLRPPADREVSRRILGRHASLVDAAAGFAGFDANGMSENPVIFRAPPDAPADIFMLAIEQMVEARLVKMRVELVRPGSQTISCNVELRRDGSDWRRSSEYRPLRIVVTSRDGSTSFKVGHGRNSKQTVEEAAIAPNASWEAGAMRRRHAALVKAAMATGKGIDAHDVGWAAVHWPPSKPHPSWGAVFQALDTIHDVNARRLLAGTGTLETEIWENPNLEDEASPLSPPAPKDLRD